MKSTRLGVVSRDGRIKWKKRRIRVHPWVGTYSFYVTLKILVLVITAALLGYGLIASALKHWQDATIIWMCGFFCMFVVWVLEYKIRMDFCDRKPNKK